MNVNTKKLKAFAKKTAAVTVALGVIGLFTRDEVVTNRLRDECVAALRSNDQATFLTDLDKLVESSRTGYAFQQPVDSAVRHIAWEEYASGFKVSDSNTERFVSIVEKVRTDMDALALVDCSKNKEAQIQIHKERGNVNDANGADIAQTLITVYGGQWIIGH